MEFKLIDEQENEKELSLMSAAPLYFFHVDKVSADHSAKPGKKAVISPPR